MSEITEGEVKTLLDFLAGEIFVPVDPETEITTPMLAARMGVESSRAYKQIMKLERRGELVRLPGKRLCPVTGIMQMTWRKP